jgi:hypothetical protein
VLAQPFRLGDRVAVSCSAQSSGTVSAAAAAARTPSAASVAAAATMTSSGYGAQHTAAAGGRQDAAAAASGSSDGSSSGGGGTPPGWFEGICEKVDLRYTVLRWADRDCVGLVGRAGWGNHACWAWQTGCTDTVGPLVDMAPAPCLVALQCEHLADLQQRGVSRSRATRQGAGPLSGGGICRQRRPNPFTSADQTDMHLHTCHLCFRHRLWCS